MSELSLSTHVLDLDSGRPADSLFVELFGPDQTTPLVTAWTDADGRIRNWDRKLPAEAGVYQLVFNAGAWFEARGKSSFYARIPIAFRVEKTDEHYHVPLLMNAYGYSTYRGS